MSRPLSSPTDINQFQFMYQLFSPGLPSMISPSLPSQAPLMPFLGPPPPYSNSIPISLTDKFSDSPKSINSSTLWTSFSTSRHLLEIK